MLRKILVGGLVIFGGYEDVKRIMGWTEVLLNKKLVCDK
jgi:hypothetical protein